MNDNNILIAKSHRIKYYDIENHILFETGISMKSYQYENYEDIDWYNYKLIYSFSDKPEGIYKYKIEGFKVSDIDVEKQFEDNYNYVINIGGGIDVENMEEFIKTLDGENESRMIFVSESINSGRYISLGDLYKILERLKTRVLS